MKYCYFSSQYAHVALTRIHPSENVGTLSHTPKHSIKLMADVDDSDNEIYQRHRMLLSLDFEVIVSHHNVSNTKTQICGYSTVCNKQKEFQHLLIWKFYTQNMTGM